MKVQLERLATPEFAAQRRSVILIIWAVILLAVPLWWHTTTVYRAPLPFSDIRIWGAPEALTLELDVQIRLHIVDRTGNNKNRIDAAALASNVAGALNQAFMVASQSTNQTRRSSLLFTVSGDVETNVPWKPDSEWTDLSDKLILASSGNGVYDIHVDCSLSDTNDTIESVFVSKRRGVLLRLVRGCTQDHVFGRVSAVVAGLFGDEQRSLYRLQSDRGPHTDDHANMRILKYAREYQVVLSLLVGNPEDTVVTWNIEDAEKRYISPFLGAFENISDFALSSQILNYASLPITPESRVLDNGNKIVHVLSPKAMSSFINSAEWNLASVVSTAPPINLIVYVPPKQHSPLFLLHSNDTFVKNNAFLVPQWGGIVVQNLTTNVKHMHYSLSDLHPIMEIFVAQLRGLLGVESLRISGADELLPNVDITFEGAPDLGLTDLELDRLARARTIQNMVSAVQTLTSLANLLERLENMVVLDHIQELVVRSLDSLALAKKELANKQFTRASLHARDAIVSAEAAFFDPTMVPLLYFPEEHKFAVYMPYFVPVSVPLIVALLFEIRSAFTSWRNGKTKTKSE